METEHLSKPDRHIRISGEIKVDLERISQCPKPCRTCCQSIDRKYCNGIPECTDVVRDQDFFAKSDHKTMNTF